MKNLIKTWIVSIAMATSNLSASADNFPISQNITQNDASSQISEIFQAPPSPEKIYNNIDAKTFADAALSYFDEEVRLYELKWDARKQVESVLMSYFSAHPILKVDENGEMIFIIDDKKEFSKMIRKLTDAILSWMSPFMRTIGVAIVFWWHSWLENKLNNLDETVRNLKGKEYRNIVFDYLWWIIKRVAKSVNWNMSIKWYYDWVHKYYPNKNSDKVRAEMNASWQANRDIKSLKYPFKK